MRRNQKFPYTAAQPINGEVFALKHFEDLRRPTRPCPRLQLQGSCFLPSPEMTSSDPIWVNSSLLPGPLKGGPLWSLAEQNSVCVCVCVYTRAYAGRGQSILSYLTPLRQFLTVASQCSLVWLLDLPTSSPNTGIPGTHNYALPLSNCQGFELISSSLYSNHFIY